MFLGGGSGCFGWFLCCVWCLSTPRALVSATVIFLFLLVLLTVIYILNSWHTTKDFQIAVIDNEVKICKCLVSNWSSYFHQFEVSNRGSETQLQVGENKNWTTQIFRGSSLNYTMFMSIIQDGAQGNTATFTMNYYCSKDNYNLYL